MGSGGSRSNSGDNGSSIPNNVRPILQQRYEQVKKKLQVKGKDSDGHSYQQMHDGKDSSMSSLEGKTHPSSNENSVTWKSVEGKSDDTIDGGNNNVVVGESDEEYDERMLVRRGDDDEFPASPSFRIYCTPDNGLAGEALSEEEVEEEEDKEEKEKEEEREEQNQKVELKTGKQGRRKSNFRKVIPTGGQLKNLLNVNSCSPRSQGRTHSRIEKSRA